MTDRTDTCDLCGGTVEARRHAPATCSCTCVCNRTCDECWHCSGIDCACDFTREPDTCHAEHMGTVRLVLDVIGLVSAVAGLVAPWLPRGSRAQKVVRAVGLNLGHAVAVYRSEPPQDAP